jgi:hypothetical protein
MARYSDASATSKLAIYSSLLSLSPLGVVVVGFSLHDPNGWPRQGINSHEVRGNGCAWSVVITPVLDRMKRGRMMVVERVNSTSVEERRSSEASWCLSGTLETSPLANHFGSGQARPPNKLAASGTDDAGGVCCIHPPYVICWVGPCLIRAPYYAGVVCCIHPPYVICWVGPCLNRASCQTPRASACQRCTAPIDRQRAWWQPAAGR